MEWYTITLCDVYVTQADVPAINPMFYTRYQISPVDTSVCFCEYRAH